MRITVASSGLGHVARGIEAWAADLARELDRRGLAVTLCKGGGVAERDYERVLPCRQRDAPATRRLTRMIPRWLGWRLGIGSGYGLEQATFALHLLQHLRQRDVDILHVQDPQVALVVQRANQLGWVRTRVILAHGTEEPVSFLRKVQYLQHLAPWHEEQARAAGVWNSAWTTIPNFIDTDRFRPSPAERRRMRAELAIPDDALVVLTVAAVKRHHKRIDYVLDEFSRLRSRSPELPLWFVVAGGWETETDELVARGRQMLGERIRFLIRFPRERMSQLYAAADAFALASVQEMMPIALLEATAAALPCVVHRDPVLQWLTGPGGQAADLTVPDALAHSLRRLLLDPVLRHSVGCAAREHCVRQFGTVAVADRIIEYYRFVRTHDRLSAPYPDGTVIPDRPRVSVVIPTYNSGSLVTQAIDSVLAQTVPADEIIVVDDGSTDDTRERLRCYDQETIYVPQTNVGVAAARNRGIRESTGDLIAFLDADDVWHPRKLELQLEVLRKSPHLGLLGTEVSDWPAPHSPNVADHPDGQVATVPWRSLVVRNHFTTSSVIVRRDVLEKLRAFDTDLHGPEDHDLWLRVAELAAVGKLLLPLTVYRHVDGSLSQRAATMEAGMRRILQKVEQRGGWRGRPLLRRKALSSLEYSCAYLYKSAGNPAQALQHVYRSLLKYPMPYRPSEVRLPLARLRLVVALWRQLGGGIPRLAAPPAKEINYG